MHLSTKLKIPASILSSDMLLNIVKFDLENMVNDTFEDELIGLIVF